MVQFETRKSRDKSLKKGAHSGIDRTICVRDKVVVVLPSKFPCILEDRNKANPTKGTDSDAVSDVTVNMESKTTEKGTKNALFVPSAISKSKSTPIATGLMKPRLLKQKPRVSIQDQNVDSSASIASTSSANCVDTTTVTIPTRSNADFRQFLQ